MLIRIISPIHGSNAVMLSGEVVHAITRAEVPFSSTHQTTPSRRTKHRRNACWQSASLAPNADTAIQTRSSWSRQLLWESNMANKFNATGVLGLFVEIQSPPSRLPRVQLVLYSYQISSCSTLLDILHVNPLPIFVSPKC